MKRMLCLLGVLGALILLLETGTWTAAQPAKAEFKLKFMGINRTWIPGSSTKSGPERGKTHQWTGAI